MKGQEGVLKLLNNLLMLELGAVSQYFIHARMCENWGYLRLWKKIRAESIEEMKHADRLIERILFLEGMPNLQRVGKITVGKTVPEQLRVDLELEQGSVRAYNEAVEVCRAAADHGTRELVEHILVESEAHVNWLEAQVLLLEQVGEQNYLAQQIHDE